MKKRTSLNLQGIFKPVDQPKKKSYSELLKDPRWQKRRLEVFEKDKWSCFFCGDKETTLHVHHFKYTGMPWEAPDEDMCALCEDCHWLEHAKGKMTSLERELLNKLLYPIYQWGDENGGKESIPKVKAIIKTVREYYHG